ncbi:MAG: U-box domain-containing protein 56 [Hungatella sp.]|jgi:hypothetical protein|nr:U-box domain-containing protein 56 [Hungatella sp.]
MMNEELYEELEQEFTRCRIEEEVEDVLLELAEALLDLGITGREVSVKEQAGHGKLTACGICEEGEEGEEPAVLIRTLTINDKEFEIEDYFL